MKIVLFLIVFLFNGLMINAQISFSQLEEELAMYNDYSINADSYNHREVAHKKFISLFEVALNRANSFKYPFDSLKWVSKVVAPDSSFRIFTWQLTKSFAKRDYFGLIQKRDGVVFKLVGNIDNRSDLEYSSYTEDDWIGQIYYNIHKYKKGEYILFGYKLVGEMDKIKMATPAYFENNHVNFGKEIFEDTTGLGDRKSIITLKTSSNAASSMHYDEDKKMIVYDHTVVLMLPDRRGKLRPFNVPDGSYHGYKWNGMVWRFVDKVYTRKLDHAPVYDSRKKPKKGLFGNK